MCGSTLSHPALLASRAVPTRASWRAKFSSRAGMLWRVCRTESNHTPGDQCVRRRSVARIPGSSLDDSSPERRVKMSAAVRHKASRASVAAPVAPSSVAALSAAAARWRQQNWTMSRDARVASSIKTWPSKLPSHGAELSSLPNSSPASRTASVGEGGTASPSAAWLALKTLSKSVVSSRSWTSDAADERTERSRCPFSCREVCAAGADQSVQSV